MIFQKKHKISIKTGIKISSQDKSNFRVVFDCDNLSQFLNKSSFVFTIFIFSFFKYTTY